MPEQDPHGIDVMTQEFRDSLNKDSSLEVLATALGSIAYRVGCLIEDAEKTRSDSADGFRQGLYRGNGHHAAQDIAAFAQARLAKGWHDREEAEEYFEAHASVREYQY